VVSVTDDTRPADPAAKPVWPERAIEFGAHSYAWLMRPRVRLSVIGVTLLLVGGLVAMNSVWTLPLVVIGALMVGVAWIGHRLEGHFAVEWGEAGTQLAFNATVKPPRPTPELQAPGAPALEPRSDAAPEAAVIEGEAHTVEINVGELKALIAAAEASEASTDAVVQDIRIRRLADDDARTPRPSA
jgi:hypothetical protein